MKKSMTVVLVLALALVLTAGFSQAAVKGKVPVAKSAPASVMETYEVQPEETLGLIAVKLGVTIAELKKWNPKLEVDKIKAGDEVKYLPLSAIIKTEQSKTRATLKSAGKSLDDAVRQEGRQTRANLSEQGAGVIKSIEKEGKSTRKVVEDTAKTSTKTITEVVNTDGKSTRLYFLIGGIILAIGLAIVIFLLLSVNRRSRSLTGEDLEAGVTVDGEFEVEDIGARRRFKYIYAPSLEDGKYVSLHVLNNGVIFRTSNLADLKRSLKTSLNNYLVLKLNASRSPEKEERFKEMGEVIDPVLANGSLKIEEVTAPTVTITIGGADPLAP